MLQAIYVRAEAEMITPEHGMAAVSIPEASQHTVTQNPQSGAMPGDAHRGSREHSSNRNRQSPVPVEATVYWCRIGERKSLCSANHFGLVPTTPIRFRCVGSITPKHPKRYRVELAQALDWLPDLTARELKDLGAKLAVAVSEKLGVEVVPFNWEVIDLNLEDGRR